MEEASAPGHTVVHVYNVPSGIDRQQFNEHVGQLTTGRHVDTSINRLNKAATLTFEGSAKILKTTSALHDQTLFVMPEIIESVTVTVQKPWADLLRHCGKLDLLLKPGVTVVKDTSSFALRGSDKNNVFSSLDNCREFAAKYFAMVGDHGSKSRQTERASVSPPHRVETTAATTSGAIVESVVNIDLDVPAEKQLPSKPQHYTVDESLWDYIKFTDPDSDWASKLTAVTCVDGSGKTDLYGTADDIEAFTKLCSAGRLQRTVVGKMVRVPDGFTANTFAAVVGQLARKTALVRSTSDPGFCQVICKSSAFDELTQTINARFTASGPTLAAVEEQPADIAVKSKVSDNAVVRQYAPSSVGQNVRQTVRTVDTDQQLDVMFNAPRTSVSLQQAADVKSSKKLSQSQSFSVKSTDVSFPAASYSSASSKSPTKLHPASGTSDPHVALNSYSYPHALGLGTTAVNGQVPMFQAFRASAAAEPTGVSPTVGTSKTIETGHTSSLMPFRKDRDVELYQQDTAGTLTAPPFVFTGTKSSAPQVQSSSDDWKYMHKVMLDDPDLPLMTDATVEHASAETMNFQPRTVYDIDARPHRKSAFTGAQRSEISSKPQLKSGPKPHVFSKTRSDVAGPRDVGPVLVSAAVQSPSNPSLVTLSADSYVDETGYDDLTSDFSLPRASVDTLPGTSVQSRSKSAVSPVKLSQKLLSAADSSADDDKNCVEFVTPRSQLKVRLTVGDILRQSDCDVIVTPCGKNLEHTTGLAKVVAKAAGSDLVLQCRDYMQINRKGMCVGDVIDTVAGNLFPPVNRVIHCCVPTSRDAHCQQLLTKTYRRCIAQAYSKIHAESVAIPALGSGAAGVPINTVAAAVCSALMEFDDYLSQQQQKEHLGGGVTFIDLNADAIKCIADGLSHLGLTSKGSLPDTANSVKSQSKTIDYTQLTHHAELRGLLIVEVPMDGDCALHAIVDQLNNALNSSSSSKGNNPFVRPYYNVKTLRQRAVAHLMSNPPDKEFLVKSEYRSLSQYIARQSVAGTWCDEPMLRAVAEVTDTEIHVLHENGRTSILQSSASRSSDTRGPINVGLVGTHYVSLRPSSSSSSAAAAAAAAGGDDDTLFPLSQMRSKSSSAFSKFSRSQTTRHSIDGSLANYSKPDSRRVNDKTTAFGDVFSNKSRDRRTTIHYPSDLLQ